jgi:hypothetical protein
MEIWTHQIKSITAQENWFLCILIAKHMSSPFILSTVKVGLSQKVEVTIYDLIFLQYRSGHIRHASNRRRGNVIGSESSTNARTSTLESGVCRSELCRVLLDSYQLLPCPRIKTRADINTKPNRKQQQHKSKMDKGFSFCFCIIRVLERRKVEVTIWKQSKGSDRLVGEGQCEARSGKSLSSSSISDLFLN